MAAVCLLLLGVRSYNMGSPARHNPWPVAGGSSTRNNSLGGSGGVRSRSGGWLQAGGGTSWLYSVPSQATASGIYASLALDGEAVYALVHTEVHKLDAATGVGQWLASPFNPRGPVLVDADGNSFISWTGSSSAAGLISYDSGGTQRWQTFCPRSGNMNYDVSALAIDSQSALYCACQLWDVVTRSITIKVPPQPATAGAREQPVWQGRSCSVKVDPLVVRNSSSGAELAVFGGCSPQNNRRASVVALDTTNGSVAVEFRTFYGETALATAMWDSEVTLPPPSKPVGGHARRAASPAPLFVFNDNGELCSFPFSATETWRFAPALTVSNRYGPCLPVIQPPVSGGSSRGISRARLMLARGAVTAAAHGTGSGCSIALLQGFNQLLKGQGGVRPDLWWVAAVSVCPNVTASGPNVTASGSTPALQLLWNRTEGASGNILDHSINMAWALGELLVEEAATMVLLTISPDNHTLTAMDPHTGTTIGQMALSWRPRAVATDSTGSVFVSGLNGSQWVARTVVQRWSASDFAAAMSQPRQQNRYMSSAPAVAERR
jgi:hypothetical protein